MASERSWSNLPTKLLQIICEKLIEIDDYALFGIVCTPWRNALWLSSKKIPPQPPVLMCPNYSRNYSSGTHSHRHVFFRFSSAKTDNHDYYFSRS
ncbi:hypothetical protein FRX31_023754 [Thalictrum thalictroides]|uniref:F-box domain-containing protein n=1 Tax=Thalictrum thalictroides TaxID=46969 RepID=A0A7J6VR35_THATH|nr:hypothetical protein FRX31_023754 [Thalictrum thalictroides]